jgi:UDP-N-acetylmuramyl pentapeptide synthase
LALEGVEEATGDLDEEVKGLTYDSRKAHKGQVFFALPGEKVDGHDYIRAAVGQGASAFVFSRPGDWPRAVATVRVKDSRRAMGLWAAHFFARIDLSSRGIRAGRHRHHQLSLSR